MWFAEVSVNSPFARRQAFSYSIPSNLNLEPGHAVWVPFGQKVLQGIVMETSPVPSFPDTRDILGLIEPEPLLSPAHLALARWISDYYLSPLFAAVALMLPPGFERDPVTFLRTAAGEHDASDLTPEQTRILESLAQGEIKLVTLQRQSGKRRADVAIAGLARRGLVEKRYEPEPVKVKFKQAAFVSLSVSREQAEAEAARLRESRARKQADVLDALVRSAAAVPMNEVKAATGCQSPTVQALVDRGLVKVEMRRMERDTFHLDGLAPSLPLILTCDQEQALDAIRNALRDGAGKVFLLHGVTGSGKTEVYLRALAEAVKLGKHGLALVPEISLTPQTIERFAGRFPGRVGLIHSRLSLGEQFDEWWRTRRGEVDVVVGARGAIFAPQRDLGLIVIDEEHEWTYKQQDQSPRYHAREVALKLAELTGAVVVLGSATPDVESYYRAETGKYLRLELPERIVGGVPEIDLVDIREELKSGNRSVFSRKLAACAQQALARREQVILFLNRRGTATYVQCRRCGFLLKCKRCEISLILHEDSMLVCHHCNYRAPMPLVCPVCSSPRFKLAGLGTEKLEQEARSAFPRARCLRWDSDTVREKHSHEQILRRFREHRADILIGTQMVAKGLDLPLVTLVGIVNADTNLNLPDVRSGERTFQLITQAAGRAGRGSAGSRVIIQTFSPQHYAIRAAARQDYAGFYAQEMAIRRQFNDPPFSHLALLMYSHGRESACREEAERVKRLLVEQIEIKGLGGIDVLGPAPAFARKLRGRFRWQLILRGSGLSAFLADIRFPAGWSVDIDPVNLL